MSVTLYDYQHPPLQEIRQHLASGIRAVILNATCGYGKGHTAVYIIESAVNKGKRVVFLVNRKGIVVDQSQRLDKIGLDHGIIQADNPRRKPWLPVQIASIDTLNRREKIPPADLVIVDECHFAASPSWKSILRRYFDSGAAILGLSATPARLDGKSLKDAGFQRMVYGPSPFQMVQMNSTDDSKGSVPIRVFAPDAPNLKGVEKIGGEYNQWQLAEVCMKRKLIGDILGHWLKLGRGRPSVGFAVDKAHGRKLTDEFSAAGVRTAFVEDETPMDERSRCWESLKNGTLEIVWSVGIISYGWDCPPVSCGVDAAPTASVVRFLQRVGRLARALPGKRDSLLLDHSGNTHQFGFFEDERIWSLEDERQGRRKDDENEGPPMRTCLNCFAVVAASFSECPECGTPFVSHKRKIEHVSGELKEIKPERWYKCDACSHKGRLPEGVAYDLFPCARCQTGPLLALASRYDSGQGEVEKKSKYIRWYCEGAHKGYKPGWAGMRFKQVFGHWPPRAWLEEAQTVAAMELSPVGVMA